MATEQELNEQIDRLNQRITVVAAEYHAMAALLERLEQALGYGRIAYDDAERIAEEAQAIVTAWRKLKGGGE